MRSFTMPRLPSGWNEGEKSFWRMLREALETLARPIRMNDLADDVKEAISNQNPVPEPEWRDLEIASGSQSPAPSLAGTRKLQIKKDGNHVFISGTVQSKAGTNITTVPSDCVPIYQTYWFAPCQGNRIARIIILTSGVLHIEWVRNLSNGTDYTNDVWLDLEDDYWLD